MPGIRAAGALRRSPLLPAFLPVLLFLPAGKAAGQPDQNAAAQQCEASVQASDWDEAVTRCEAAIRANPDSFGIHYFLGFAHEGRRSWAASAAAFEAFLAAAEASADGRSRMGTEIAFAVRSAGIAHFRAGNRERALPLLQRAAAADPEDPEVSFWLGVNLLDEGDPNGAEAALSVVVREAPHIAQAHFFLARIRFDAEDYSEARTRLAAYLAADPEGPFRTEAHWMAGSIALRTSGAEEEETAIREEAMSHFAALLEAEPDGPRAAVAHYFLGTVAADREECETARLHYERFLEIAPNHERARAVESYLEGSLDDCRIRGESRFRGCASFRTPSAPRWRTARIRTPEHPAARQGDPLP